MADIVLLVMQQGGSTAEWGGNLYDDAGDAEGFRQALLAVLKEVVVECVELA